MRKYISQNRETRKPLTIRETQEISLEVLKTVADICEEHNFRYFLVYGTLIGAIRHKDYIPWDDDVDIMMPRKDYEAFLKYMKKHIGEYEHLKVFNRHECKAYPYMITRISDDRYEIVMDNEEAYGMGVFIDIYPYDGLGDTWKEALKNGRVGDRLSSFCYQATRKHYAVECTQSALKKMLKLPVFVFAKLVGKEFFQNRLEKLAGFRDYETSRYVGCIQWLTGGAIDIFKREWFDDYVMAPFGKYEFRVPHKYHEVLTHAYGDYMQLPPEKDRVGHHYYKVYKK